MRAGVVAGMVAVLLAATTVGGQPPDLAAAAPDAEVATLAVAREPVADVSTSRADARIASVLAARTKSQALGKHVTMTVFDPVTHTYAYQRRAGASLRGASTTKLLTAVAVLKTLGPDHRLPTTVRRGTAPGELVLVAGGDPLLTSKDLRTLAKATGAALRTSPPGSAPAVGVSSFVVRADDSLFSGPGQSMGWKKGWLPSEVRPVGAFARDDRKVRDATADAGRYFTNALAKEGVKARYGGEKVAPKGAPAVAAIPGHTVGQAVSRALLVSDNDAAEMLFRHVAVATGRPGTWAGARTAVAETLRSLGIPLAGARVVDGSGLSLTGRVTSAELTAALALGLSPAHPELAGLRGSLPVAGKTGSLKSSAGRFNKKPAKCAVGRVQAKTGTLADSIALAGYATAADNQTRIFVAVVNDRPTKYSRDKTRQALDKVAASVTGCW